MLAQISDEIAEEKKCEMTSELQPSISGSLHLMQRNVRHLQRN